MDEIPVADFVDSRTDVRYGFEVARLFAELYGHQFETQRVPYVSGHFAQVFLAGTEELQGFHDVGEFIMPIFI